MKHIADIQPGGFIVDNEYHVSIGEMIKERDAAILALAGDNAIISGVQVSGSNHTAGVVAYNGKLYSFIAGVTQTSVTTKKVALDRPNANQVDAPAFYKDVIEFGNDGFETFNFSDLVRYYPSITKIKEIKIIGRNITNAELTGTGWFLANGANGTDNLINKFFVVAGGDHTVGSTVGSKTKTIAAANLPNASTSLYVGQKGNGFPDGNGNTIAIGHSNSYVTQSKLLTLGDFGANNTPLDVTPLSFAVVAIQFIGI